MKTNSNTYMIEGIGDEVVHFFLVVFSALLVIAAWCSTRTRVLDTRLSNIIVITHWLQSRLLEARINQMLNDITGSLNDYTSLWPEADLLQTENPREMNSSTNAPENSTSAQNGEGAFPKQNGTTVPNGDDPTDVEDPHAPNSNTVKIKLKFSNASEKICDVNLNEKLGDFKRRNFSSELSRGNNVVLIFFGRILNDDEKTLGACGFFGDCVVHCLVREPWERRGTRRRRREGDRASRRLVLVLSVLLLGVWYYRARYTELFSLTAKAGLLVLTGLYLAFLASHYVLPPGPRANLPHRAYPVT